MHQIRHHKYENLFQAMLIHKTKYFNLLTLHLGQLLYILLDAIHLRREIFFRPQCAFWLLMSNTIKPIKPFEIS